MTDTRSSQCAIAWVLALALALALLAGCGEAPSMNEAEAKSFAPPKGAARDPKAAQGIKDFKARFEASHGGAANNVPANAQTPAGNQ